MTYALNLLVDRKLLLNIGIVLVIRLKKKGFSNEIALDESLGRLKANLSLTIIVEDRLALVPGRNYLSSQELQEFFVDCELLRSSLSQSAMMAGFVGYFGKTKRREFSEVIQLRKELVQNRLKFRTTLTRQKKKHYVWWSELWYLKDLLTQYKKFKNVYSRISSLVYAKDFSYFVDYFSRVFKFIK